jgi:hypothetical protein
MLHPCSQSMTFSPLIQALDSVKIYANGEGQALTVHLARPCKGR